MRSFSVFCFSISSSSVLSLINSSRLEEYCSNIRNMESMMLVFFPLLTFLNCREIKGIQRKAENIRILSSKVIPTAYQSILLFGVVVIQEPMSVISVFNLITFNNCSVKIFVILQKNASVKNCYWTLTYHIKNVKC